MGNIECCGDYEFIDDTASTLIRWDFEGVPLTREATPLEVALRHQLRGAVEALRAIADGRWNVGAPRDLDIREFARQEVARLTTSGGAVAIMRHEKIMDAADTYARAVAFEPTGRSNIERWLVYPSSTEHDVEDGEAVRLIALGPDVDAVTELVPASQLQGAVEERDRYRMALEEIADHDLTAPSALTARVALGEFLRP